MLIECPARLDEAGFEVLVARIGSQPRPPSGVNLSDLRFADPAGLLGLLCIGLSSRFRGGQAFGLVLPERAAVRTYLERCGAMGHLARLFVLEGAGHRSTGPCPPRSESVSLLEVEAIREGPDVHRAVARLKGRADLLLVSRLGYSPLAVDRFTVALAEVCRNIVDHSGGAGFASAQFYPRGAGRVPEVRIAVADAGVGVRVSLAPRYAARHEGAWNDGAALRLAFRRGVSRSGEPGRGLGLAAVADTVRRGRWLLRLRSGTAAHRLGGRFAGDAPSSGLTAFPGTQVSIRIAHLEDHAPR